jgi:predicted nucleic acid-binding protein
MIVVADTTPINYLILIGEIDVLAKLYGRVVIPSAVQEELTRSRTPENVRAWILRPPAWLEILSPAPFHEDTALAKLDAGERDAIALAEELSADQLIVDEILGRREAERRGLSVIGTIGVLREAAEEGLLDLRISIERLRQTSFHISPAILAALLKNLI